MNKFSNRAYTLFALIAIAFCMVLIATFTFTTDVALAADESGEEVKPVAIVTSNDTEITYATFAEAVQNATSGSTIKLLDNGSLCNINSKTIAINLNGKTLSFDSSANGRIQLNNSKITIFDDSDTETGCIAGQLLEVFSSVTINSGNIDVKLSLGPSATLNMNGGRIKRLM